MERKVWLISSYKKYAFWLTERLNIWTHIYQKRRFDFFFFWVKKVLIFGSIKEIVFGLEFGFEVKKKKYFDFRDFILE